MANETITNNDIGSVALGGDVVHEDLPVKFAGAGTIAEGTILARDTSDQTLVPFVIGGVANGNGVPHSVATYDIVATGAGNIASRVLVSGKVRKQRLIVVADGDDANINAAVRQDLIQNGIVPVDVAELGQLDNQ